MHGLKNYVYKLIKINNNMEQKDNTGALFANDKKTADNHPDYNGKCMVDGKMKDLAAWVKTSKSGQKYLSISIKEPYKAITSPQANDRQSVNVGHSDLPF